MTTIPDQHRSGAADLAALAVLGLLFTALVGHCAYELRRIARASWPPATR